MIESLRRRHLLPSDLGAFLLAARLARRAQEVERQPIPDVLADLMGCRFATSRLSPERLERAVIRAAARWAEWRSGRDTCLVRSLVLGRMLSSRADVVLNIGFRAGEPTDRPRGHAWLTVDGATLHPGESEVGDDFSRILQLPFEPPGGPGAAA